MKELENDIWKFEFTENCFRANQIPVFQNLSQRSRRGTMRFHTHAQTYANFKV